MPDIYIVRTILSNPFESQPLVESLHSRVARRRVREDSPARTRDLRDRDTEETGGHSPALEFRKHRDVDNQDLGGAAIQIQTAHWLSIQFDDLVGGLRILRAVGMGLRLKLEADQVLLLLGGPAPASHVFGSTGGKESIQEIGVFG